MRSCIPGFGALLFALALLSPSAALGADAAPPQANRVIVRGRTQLVDALEAAIGPASKPEHGPTITSGQGPSVLFILDVTPYTAARGGDLVAALAALEARCPGPGRWSFARLGEKPCKAFARPTALGPIVRASLSKDTDVGATLPALARTLELRARKGGRVVYLADWHFEDDQRPEGLLDRLKARKQTFSVVGSEAALGRGWNDGFSWIGKNLGRS